MENQIHTAATGTSDFSKTVKTQINLLLDLSKRELNGNEFYSRFTQGFCKIVGESTGLIWQVFEEQVGLLATFPTREHESPKIGEIDAQHLLALKSSVNQNQPIVQSVASDDFRGSLASRNNSGDSSPAASTSILYRLIQDGKSAVVLEVICDSNDVEKKQATIKRILPAFQELAQDYHRNSELIELRKKSQSGDRLFEFAKLLCTNFDSHRIAFEIANSAVRILEIDRAAIVSCNQGKLNLTAVSGVSTIDRNSDASTRLLQMIGTAIDSGLPYIPSATAQGDQEATVDDRKGNSSSAEKFTRPFAVFSLDCNQAGSSVLENSHRKQLNHQTLLFVETDDIARIERLDPNVVNRFIELASLRVRQANREIERQSWFAVSPANWLRSRTAVGWISAVTVLIVLALLPAQLKIRATGQVVPVDQRGVYSPVDGDVVEVLVKHDEPVKIGDPLVRIHSSELDFELAKLLGENKATIEKLQAIESRQINNPDRSNNSNVDVESLSTSVVELKIMKKSQKAQIDILRKRIGDLTVRSPIEGRVITWQLGKLLDARRVRQGQLLMTIADTDGQWHGELEINDTRVGHVLNAFKNKGHSVSASCVFVSNPDLACHGQIISIDQSTKESLIGTSVVNAIAEFDFPPTIEQRPGAKIVAKIHCGRRSLGYVWFHELIDTVRASFF